MREPSGKNDITISIIRAVLIAAAVFFVVIGIIRGDLRDVFVKASKICMECIGIG